MFFPKDTPLTEIQHWINLQLSGVYSASKNGIDIEIKPHKNLRSNAQNKFLMVICTHIVKFYHETGYVLPGLKAWAMQPAIVKEYWKDRFGIESSKRDTAEFTKFIDFIQQTMVEETGGEYEILTTDSQYLKSLLQE